MRERRYIPVAVILLFAGIFSCNARISGERKKFETRTVVEKGENMATISLMSASLNSNNSELMLIANNLCLDGAFFRVAPSYSYAYHNNLVAGVRVHFMAANANIDNANINLLNPDLNFDFSNSKLYYTNWGASVYHREYLGLDRKGSVGLYLEEAVRYNNARTNYGGGVSATGQSISLLVAPGFILYILPFVSVQMSLGIAEVGYSWTSVYENGVKRGSRDRAEASASLNVLNLNFGITWHF